MKFTCDQNTLLLALSIVTRAISSKASLDILDCVLLDAAADSVTLTCTDTDLALGIEHALPVKLANPGRIALPGKLLHEVVRKLSPGEVSITVNDRLIATVSCGGARTTLAGRSADDFPSLPEVEGHGAEMDAERFRAMVRQTGFAAATDEARLILTGTLVEIEDTDVTMVALDGYRLSLCKGTLSQPCAAVSVTPPARSLSEIARIVPEGRVSLLFSKSHMMARWADTRVVVRLLEGDFIKYRQILPSEWKTRMVVRRRELDDALDRAALMAREGKNNLVHFSLSNDALVLTASSELGDARDEMEALVEGAPLDIAFNVRFLADIIKNVGDECLVFRFQGSVSPCILVPEDGDEYLFMILPVRV